MNKSKLQTGLIKRHPDGFGFFIPDQAELPDVYVPRHSMSGVMTNDRVTLRVEPERGTGRFRGEVVRILERGTKKVVGTFFAGKGGGGWIKDEGQAWGQDMKIEAPHTLGAKDKELVAAEISQYPEDNKSFSGKIVQVIGNSEDPLNDITRIVHALNIPSEFPAEVTNEVSKWTPDVDEKDIKARKDLRSLKFVTIDGATAKDFDDAILVESTAQGFRLFVAIADVSHYVRPGSAVDREAYQRGTSVYFPNFVIPMLPEILSNELCSLNPHKPRLALVAEIDFDFTGEKKNSKFYEATIQSAARVTYGEAQEIIEGAQIAKLKHVESEIKKASDLAKILMARRFAQGSLDLEIPEVQLLIDGSGVPIDIVKSERLFAHRLIEEMMLAANVAVAEFLQSRDVPALYRIHEPPHADAIAVLEKYLRTFGSRVKLGEGMLQKRLTKALQEFDGKPEAQVLNILTLRSMSQAKYSPHNVGHFGLGFENYSHFTSPIRRYPDLIIHRLLKSQIMPQSRYRLMSEEDLVSAGTMLSACEQRSVKAERQIQSIKRARFMVKHVGEEFEGMISSVTKFGIFVMLRQFEVDGLVHMDYLGQSPGDRFEFDEEHLTLTAKRSGKTYRIGDQVKIVVVSADPIEGKIDFQLAGMAQASLSKNKKPQPKAGKGAAKDILDLDALPPHDHAKDIRSRDDQDKFDPGRKLAEALRRRGLKPTLDEDSAEAEIGFRSNWSQSRPQKKERSFQKETSQRERRRSTDGQEPSRRTDDGNNRKPGRKKNSGSVGQRVKSRRPGKGRGSGGGAKRR